MLRLDLYSSKFEDVGNPSQMRRRPTEQIADRFQLQPAYESEAGLTDSVRVAQPIILQILH